MAIAANGLPLHADLPPLRVHEGGAVRVGGTRISLDSVVEQYENGMTPEDMIRAYDTLNLADVHAVIAYYPRHRDEVRAYLKRRVEEAEALQVKIEAERPRVSRDDLPARRSAREKGEAAMNDPIVDEVRRVRDAHAARFNYDLRAIFRDIKEQEKKSGLKFVSFAATTGEPKEPVPPSDLPIFRNASEP